MRAVSPVVSIAIVLHGQFWLLNKVKITILVGVKESELNFIVSHIVWCPTTHSSTMFQLKQKQLPMQTLLCHTMWLLLLNTLLLLGIEPLGGMSGYVAPLKKQTANDLNLQHQCNTLHAAYCLTRAASLVHKNTVSPCIQRQDILLRHHEKYSFRSLMLVSSPLFVDTLQDTHNTIIKRTKEQPSFISLYKRKDETCIDQRKSLPKY